jgi:DNA-binding transcriptional LysR family regulator
MMYNPQLDTFICVVEAGSFSKAADKLYISPPAVIKQINSLENNLGVQLFARTHRGLVVTAAGESLYQDAKYMVNYSKEAIERAKEAGNDEDDVIRVGISPMTPPQVFVELWPRIQEQYPNVKFKLVPFENTPENAREILANLGQNIDVIAGIFDETMLELRKCNGVELSREPFCVAVALHHRLAGKKVLTPEDLKGERLLMMRKGWSCYVDALRAELTEKYPEITIADFDFYNVDIFNRCENSNDMLLAIKSWESVHPLMKILPVEWDYKMPYGLLYAKDPSEKVEKLVRTVEGITK